METKVRDVEKALRKYGWKEIMALFGIVVERGPEGDNWSAFCPQTSGACCTTGFNLEEIKANTIEALRCYYADDPSVNVDGVYELSSEEIEAVPIK